jgi:hypothetical protein
LPQERDRNFWDSKKGMTEVEISPGTGKWLSKIMLARYASVTLLGNLGSGGKEIAEKQAPVLRKRLTSSFLTVIHN